MTRSTNMEHVEVLRDLSEVCRAAIKAGDWKVDGACDPDSLLRHADAAIAALSAPKPEGDVVVTRNEGGEIVAVTRQDAEGRILSIIAEAAQQPPAEAQPVAWLSDWKHAANGGVTRDADIAAAWEARGEVTPLYAHPPPSAPVGVEDESVRVGNLPTMNQDGYPGLGEWWVQLWRGDEIIARVYGDGPDEVRSQAQDIADALNQQPAAAKGVE